MLSLSVFFFFFFNDTAPTEIYTLSLHDALPILELRPGRADRQRQPLVDAARARDGDDRGRAGRRIPAAEDRKSTRLNSSHLVISYAVFCLKKKKNSKILLVLAHVS